MQLIAPQRGGICYFTRFGGLRFRFSRLKTSFFTKLKMHSRFGTKLLNQRRSYLVFCSIVKMFLYLQSCLLSIQVVFNVSFQISWQNSGNKMILLDLFLVLLSPIVKMGFHEIPWNVDFCTKSPRKTAHRKLHSCWHQTMGSFVKSERSMSRDSEDLEESRKSQDWEKAARSVVWRS